MESFRPIEVLRFAQDDIKQMARRAAERDLCAPCASPGWRDPSFAFRCSVILRASRADTPSLQRSAKLQDARTHTLNGHGKRQRGRFIHQQNHAVELA